jgi:hypothetical protein
MSRQCAAMRCAEPATGYSTHCDSHRRTLRRHGHPEQKGVTVFELQPFLDRIAARRTKNPTNTTWPLLQRRWGALTAHADATLQKYATGVPAVSYEHQTAEQLLILRDSVPGDEVIDVALAMFLFCEHRPSRFKSDRAFGFQLARRVRALADVNTGSHWSTKEGRMKRTYRDIPPRVLDCLAESLKVAFGVAGLRLAELDKQDDASVHAERRELHDALKEMK